jgi:hypothetical protein
MSESTLLRNEMKRAPCAPSITRWSYDTDSGNIMRGANSLPFHTGRNADLPTPRIATSGALMMGVKWEPPRPPRLEIEKQPP